ncbi:response regulator [Arcobacter arenosus]|uniref:Response regulator transcription factor n=1 Tax=Arcobacter arenosus TaxID=2576037 RepID=A0A5R8Y367_9BACT|nr:response regulator [Arcobacter arenosus]TLP40516.1 response regulator transcription factor [Arcobacter arenosus]
MIPVMIVEDELIVAMELENFINSKSEYKLVARVNNIDDALYCALEYKPQVILMDINIKGKKDGITSASLIGEKINTTFIYLTAYCDENTVNRALKTSPVSYLLKPFNREELYVALKLASNTYHNLYENCSKVGDILLDKEFSFDSVNKQLILNGEFIHLTKREKELLNLLIKSKNSVVSIYDMENEIWPDKLPNENTRRTLVCRLRIKLNNKFIETIPAIGYRINI